MGNIWSLRHVRTARCALGSGMCVSLKHGLVIVSGSDYLLHAYSLEDGSLVRTIGSQGQFSFDSGGLCITPDGDSVLLAENYRNRVQRVNIMDGSCIRFIGNGVLCEPEFVDCNDKVIVVSEDCCRISVLSWRTGDLISQFGSYGTGPGQLMFSAGLRLLGNGTQLVVADYYNRRLCVFRLDGEFVGAVGSKEHGLSRDVLECTDGFIVANTRWAHELVILTSVGEVESVFRGPSNGEFQASIALAALPDGGLVMRKWNRLLVFRGLGLRVQWITACMLTARVVVVCE